MKIGIPKEIKEMEFRVAVIPDGVFELITDGHSVMVEKGAGVEAGFSDKEYELAGGVIIESKEEIFASCDMIIKVKEPQPSEYGFIKPGQIIFTFFHFASSELLTKAMQKSGAVCIAYETLELSDGSLPLLIPMSEIAGKLAAQNGAYFLERHMGGSGILLGGVPGVKPGTVTIIGGGTAGENAALMAAGMGARVYILDIDFQRLRYLSRIMPSNVSTIYSGESKSLSKYVESSDLVIGSVLIHGAKTPRLITRKMLSGMHPGSVFVDISVDQGGCSETTHATSHTNPSYVEEGVIHYAVANIPGTVGRTATFALSNATLPYISKIAVKGLKVFEEPEFRRALNIMDGEIIYPALKKQFGN